VQRAAAFGVGIIFGAPEGGVVLSWFSPQVKTPLASLLSQTANCIASLSIRLRGIVGNFERMVYWHMLCAACRIRQSRTLWRKSHMTENAAPSEKQKLQEKMQKLQAKLRSIEAKEKEREARKLAKAKDDLFKVLVDLGLGSVQPAKLKAFLVAHKAELAAIVDNPAPLEGAQQNSEAG
jgi:hypothetical protein